MPECMAQDGLPAVFVGTFLQNGTSVAVCDEHMVYFCADTLAQMTGLDPSPFIAAISEEGPVEAPEAPAEAPEAPPEPPEEPAVDPTPPTPLRGRMRAVSSAPPTDGAGEKDTTTAEAASATPAT